MDPGGGTSEAIPGSGSPDGGGDGNDCGGGDCQKEEGQGWQSWPLKAENLKMLIMLLEPMTAGLGGGGGGDSSQSETTETPLPTQTPRPTQKPASTPTPAPTSTEYTTF